MFPWFYGLQSNLETPEVIEGGTWSDPPAAHQDIAAAHPSLLAYLTTTEPFRLSFLPPASSGASARCRMYWSAVDVTTGTL